MEVKLICNPEREESAGKPTNCESKLPNGKAIMTNEELMNMMTDMGLHEGGMENWVMDNAWVEVAKRVAAHEREECVAIVLDNSDAEGICCTDDVLEALRQRGEK